MPGDIRAVATRYAAPQSDEQFIPVLVLDSVCTEATARATLAEAEAFVRRARIDSSGTVDGFVLVKHPATVYQNIASVVAVKRDEVIFVSKR